MGLFKRFTDADAKPKATKAELASFKAKLKYGTDPQQIYTTAREHWENYHTMMEDTKVILQRILKSPNCEIVDKWSKLDIQDYGDDCKKSPVGKHVYQSAYGSKHPDRYKATNCICCGKELYAERKKEDE